MNIASYLKKFWVFLKKDTWQSWIVSLILIIILIRFILFPTLSLVTGSPLPLVVVESCSMYHNSGFETWWDDNGPLYDSLDITKFEFESYPMKNGLNKGDIILVLGRSKYNSGDIIIFNAGANRPIIHRLISTTPLSTKGDNNLGQDPREINIPQDAILGKSAVKIPLIGWIKLIFFEPFRSPDARGFC
jgi:signal peptidase I